jgi:hypothetical protein
MRLRGVAAIVAFVCASLVGAGSVAASTPHDLTGDWSCCQPGSGGVATQTWTITTMDKSSGAFSGTGKGGSFTFPISGTANGNSLTLTTGPYDQLKTYTAVFKGTISDDSKTMSGDWDDDSSPEPSGTWTATRPSAPTPSEPDDSPETGGGSGGSSGGGSGGGSGGSKAKAVAGDIYFSDSSANTGSGAVYKVNPETGTTTLVHLGPPFSGIRDIAFGPDGNLYVADIGASAIHKIDLKNARSPASRNSSIHCCVIHGGSSTTRRWGTSLSPTSSSNRFCESIQKPVR